MKNTIVTLMVVGVLFMVGCQIQQETMILLDEKITEVKVAKSAGVGDVSEDFLLSVIDPNDIKIFEKTILSAVKKESTDNKSKPDFDIIVEYGDEFPAHAIHLWLGEEDEKSTLMYVVGEGETYITSAENTNLLRSLLYKE